MLNSEDIGLQEMVQKQCAEEFECSKKIAKFIETEIKHRLPDEELSYLAIHIKKVRSYEDRAKDEKD
ncbi:Transcription antiterminator LicT [compost metagenome]